MKLNDVGLMKGKMANYAVMDTVLTELDMLYKTDHWNHIQQLSVTSRFNSNVQTKVNVTFNSYRVLRNDKKLKVHIMALTYLVPDQNLVNTIH